MDYINIDSCSLCISDIGRRAYINSVSGRGQVTNDLSGKDEELLEKVFSVWGDAPTVEDELLQPLPTFNDLKAQKKSKIAAARYNAETAGVVFNDVLIDTGRDSQALITGAALAAVIDGEYSLNWETVDGFIHLSAPEIIAVAQAVRAHVQSCFDREGELVAQVDAAQNVEELEAIEITFK